MRRRNGLVCPTCMIRLCEHPLLSPRQVRFLRLIESGELRYKEIAYEMDMAPNTARSMAAQIYHKIGVSNKTQAAQWVTKNKALLS